MEISPGRQPGVNGHTIQAPEARQNISSLRFLTPLRGYVAGKRKPRADARG